MSEMSYVPAGCCGEYNNVMCHPGFRTINYCRQFTMHTRRIAQCPCLDDPYTKTQPTRKFVLLVLYFRESLVKEMALTNTTLREG